MEVHWNFVPARFHYLDNSVLQHRLNDLLVVPWVDSLSRPACLSERTALNLDSGLTKSELAELADVYIRILQREDNLALLDWYVAAAGSDEQTAASWVKRLLSLLRELGEYQLEPFRQQLIQDSLKPTYKNLPPELDYLRVAIERHCADLPDGPEDGPIAQGMYFLRKSARLLTGERKRMRLLGARIEKDYEAIQTWYQENRRTPEAGEWLSLENILVSAGFLSDDLSGTG